MTTSTSAMLARQQAGARGSSTPWGRIAAVAASVAVAASALTWPAARWRDDPVGFTRTVLGIEPWEKQEEILVAVRDNDRTAVSSGHKVSKSCSIGCLALWFYATREDARAIVTCVTDRQVNEIAWREIKKLHAGSGRCVDCVKVDAARRAELERAGKAGQFVPGPRPCPHSVVLDSHCKELARSGLTGDDGFRQVRGFTAKEGEAVAGVSGANLLYLVDEASGVPQEIFEAIEGNRAGGAKLVLFSNPTRTEGEHFDAFHSKSEFYKTITISSEDSPNVRAGRVVVPGLATKEWVDEKVREWGRDSPLFKVRVLGQHVKNEEGKILSLHLLEESEQRWESTSAEGRLFIGIDPAGPGDEGDESAFSVRRGFKHLALQAHRGLTGGGHLAHLLGILTEHRKKREQKPVVVVDALGKAGAEVVGTLRAYLETYPDAFELVCVRGSDRAVREPQVYEHVRDELWSNLASWVKEGGALLSDVKLAKELHAPQWHGQMSGKLRCTEKKLLRKAIGRSPDRADATALSVWEPMSLAPDNGAQPEAPSTFDDYHHESVAPDRVFDPYRGVG